MQLKKALLSILLCFAQIISASQPAEDLTPSEKLKEAIEYNNIDDDEDSIIPLIQRADVDINIKADMKTTALSRLCHEAVTLKKTIDQLTKEIESLNNTESHDKNCAISAKKRYVTRHCTVLNAIELLLRKNVNTNAVLWEVQEPHPETTLPFLFSYVHNRACSTLDINVQDKD